jgi:predicted nucleotidyltransferase component of viral defense system
LRRLALSKYADNLILKGGLFIYTLTSFEIRSTIDVDFLLRHVSNSKQEISKMITEIISEETGNDFVTFDLKGISDIALQRKYNGVSVQLIAMIKNTRTPINIDFGVGDIVVPKPEKRTLPTQLDGFIKPEINTYSLESTIAEKFDAILSRFVNVYINNPPFSIKLSAYLDIATFLKNSSWQKSCKHN